ncbi:MAG: M48 family metallopeptidase [Bacteroidia bacterium]|nr:M48 family metallopeptidase [Bacteroidia bacterium]
MKHTAIFIMVLLIALSCSTVPITGRRQVNLIPESQLTAMSLTEYKSFLSTHTLSNDATNRAMVKNVGAKIQAAVTTYMKNEKLSDRIAGYAWEFNLVEDPAVNAWCMPGGKVVVYTGLLPVTQTETALAVVMGHEIAHAIARHGNERMSQQMELQLAGAALDVALATKTAETKAIFSQAFGIGGQLGILAFSRNQETEADKLGLVFMAMAGYDPNQAIPFWERMSKMSNGSAPPVLLSTHPSDAQRIKDLNAWMPTAMKYYKKP